MVRRTVREIEHEYSLAKELKGNEAYCTGYRHALEWVLDTTIPTMGGDRRQGEVSSSSAVMMVSGDVDLDDPEIAEAMEDIRQAGAKWLDRNR